MEQSKKLSLLVAEESVQKKFEKLLGEKTPAFISSLLQVVNNNKLLANAQPKTILNAAATAAALDLQINPNLGFAWIVPYRGKAQFQMGWKGYVQLAHRTCQYNKLNVVCVHQSQFKSWNPITEFLDCDWTAGEEGPVVGYACYFRLLNGFEKFVYWPKSKMVSHAKKYSQSWGKQNSAWATNFDDMAKKTILKNTLSKYGVLSTEMAEAQLADQAVQFEPGQYEYLDNPGPVAIDSAKTDESKEKARILGHIEKSKTLEDLKRVKNACSNYEDMKLAYNAKYLKIVNKAESPSEG